MFRLICRGCLAFFLLATLSPQPYSHYRIAAGSGSISPSLLQASIVDTLSLDTRIGWPGPVIGTIPLAVGQPYYIQVSGTWSAWYASTWYTYCGAPEDAPEIPSPGTTNGKVGQDALYVFAAPRYYYWCESGIPLPAINPEPIQFSVNNGQTWTRTPATETTYQASHKYDFIVIGGGYPLQAYINDGNTPSDNYGKLTIKVFEFPLFYQGFPSTPTRIIPENDVPWHDFTYGNRNDNPDGDVYDTIGRWGCNTTSNAMILNYYAQINNIRFHTDPGVLNSWLREHDGYDSVSQVRYYRPLPSIETFAKESGLPLTLRLIDYPSDLQIKNSLSQGNPVMLQVWTNGYTHWVVATGTTIVSNVETYSINDPIWGRTTLNAHYGQPTAGVFYTYNNVDPNMSSLEATAYSPVHIIVTDPLGRKAGYDPRSDTTWDQIPDTAYIINRPYNPDGSDSPETKFLRISHPIGGGYKYELVGTGFGRYTFEIFKSSVNGIAYSENYVGEAQFNSSHLYQINYAPFIQFLPLIRK